ncbi:hypothetical protein XENTR_v10010197 [Xenopus tropicalis]|nr:hypothetical protein XENTR_v10010197 [Xenopus tropicalis]
MAAAAASNGSGMEVDVAAFPTVMAQGVTGSVTVALHPLVILNISDHWIRMRSQEGRPVQVIGALIGKQEGRNIEVMNSFELLSQINEEKITINKEYYYTKEEQFKQVFKDMEFLGWYTTGGTPDPSDIHVHKQVCEIIESPLFLKLNPMTKHTDLPVSVYESVIDIVNGEATMLLAELSYTLATEEAERIGVDHVARMTATGSGENSTGMGRRLRLKEGRAVPRTVLSVKHLLFCYSGGASHSSAQRHQDVAQPRPAHLGIC